MVAPFIWLLNGLPLLMGVVFWNSGQGSVGGVVLYCGLYLLAYRRLVRFRWG
jgi:hypothetical protein